MKWARVRSWHIVQSTRAGWRTLCGRPLGAAAEPTDGFVSGEKTCESCLRVNIKNV